MEPSSSELNSLYPQTSRRWNFPTSSTLLPSHLAIRPRPPPSSPPTELNLPCRPTALPMELQAFPPGSIRITIFYIFPRFPLSFTESPVHLQYECMNEYECTFSFSFLSPSCFYSPFPCLLLYIPVTPHTNMCTNICTCLCQRSCRPSGCVQEKPPEAGVLKKLILAGLAKLTRLKY